MAKQKKKGKRPNMQKQVEKEKDKLVNKACMCCEPICFQEIMRKDLGV